MHIQILMRITRRFRFSAGHTLETLGDNERENHGHNYELYVTLEGKVSNNVVVDISNLKKIVTEEVIEPLDHSYLNTKIEEPTMENILLWTWDKLKPKIPLLYEITLHETENNSATYRGD
jgi:6-pyruvoyltetrahydropterin/6-carboxytetrahydropterin synthase